MTGHDLAWIAFTAGGVLALLTIGAVLAAIGWAATSIAAVRTRNRDSDLMAVADATREQPGTLQPRDFTGEEWAQIEREVRRPWPG